MRDRQDIKAQAGTIAASLLTSLKSGSISVIGIQTIEEACEEATEGLWNGRDFQQLVDLTTRAVVESV